MNSISIILALFVPEAFLEQLTPTIASDAGREIVRWYGVLLFVLTYILFYSLRKRNYELLKVVFLGYMIGDILQIIFTYVFVNNVSGGWTFGLRFALVFSFIVGFARFMVLTYPSLMGYDGEEGIDWQFWKKEEA